MDIYDDILNGFFLVHNQDPQESLKKLGDLEELFKSFNENADACENIYFEMITDIYEILQSFFKIKLDVSNSLWTVGEFPFANEINISHLLQHVITFQSTFLGLDSQLHCMLDYIKGYLLLANLLNVVKVSCKPGRIYTAKILHNAITLQEYLKNFKALNNIKKMFDNQKSLSKVLKEVIRSPHNLSNFDYIKQLHESLSLVLKNLIFVNLSSTSFQENFKKYSAELVSPETNRDEIKEFYFPFFVKIDIMFNIYNFTNLNDVCIVIESPDGKSQIFNVSESDILQDDRAKNGQLKLKTSVHLNYNTWSKAASINIYIAKLQNDIQSSVSISEISKCFMSEKIAETWKSKYSKISNEVSLYIKPRKMI